VVEVKSVGGLMARREIKALTAVLGERNQPDKNR
jgi:hypothetical protein